MSCLRYVNGYERIAQIRKGPNHIDSTQRLPTSSIKCSETPFIKINLVTNDVLVVVVVVVVVVVENRNQRSC